MKGGEIDYEAYAKAMRQALSGCEICRPDSTLNHKYFNAKKGFYWSEENNEELLAGMMEHGKKWEEIASKHFKQTKKAVEIEMRACLLFGVKDSKYITEKNIDAAC